MNQDNFICEGSYLELDNANNGFSTSGYVTTNSPSLFGVFDGMGGEECGEVAAHIAAKTASTFDFSQDSVAMLTQYCQTANESICKYAVEYSVSAMGTTAAMLLFSKKQITLCNIGDSKIFRFSQDKLDQISKDHVVLTTFGKKPPLSQCLGIPSSEMLIEPYLAQGRYKNGDIYLICSDGLTDMVANDEIKKVLSDHSVQEAISVLLKKAIDNGGKDNITIILLETKCVKNKLFKSFNKSTGGNKL